MAQGGRVLRAWAIAIAVGVASGRTAAAQDQTAAYWAIVDEFTQGDPLKAVTAIEGVKASDLERAMRDLEGLARREVQAMPGAHAARRAAGSSSVPVALERRPLRTSGPPRLECADRLLDRTTRQNRVSAPHPPWLSSRTQGVRGSGDDRGRAPSPRHLLP